VPRGRRLRHAQHGDEMANAQLPTTEQIQNPQPCLSESARKSFLIGTGVVRIFIFAYENVVVQRKRVKGNNSGDESPRRD